MTIGNKMQQTIASAEGVLANLKSFALDTNDQNAKDMFNTLVQNQQSVVDTLNDRLKFIQGEEPTYK